MLAERPALTLHPDYWLPLGASTEYFTKHRMREDSGRVGQAQEGSKIGAGLLIYPPSWACNLLTQGFLCQQINRQKPE